MFLGGGGGGVVLLLKQVAVETRKDEEEVVRPLGGSDAGWVTAALTLLGSVALCWICSKEPSLPLPPLAASC